MYICTCIYIYIYTHICVYIYIYIYCCESQGFPYPAARRLLWWAARVPAGVFEADSRPTHAGHHSILYTTIALNVIHYTITILYDARTRTRDLSLGRRSPDD